MNESSNFFSRKTDQSQYTQATCKFLREKNFKDLENIALTVGVLVEVVLVTHYTIQARFQSHVKEK